jgi:hypothetical protein
VCGVSKIHGDAPDVAHTTGVAALAIGGQVQRVDQPA